MPNVKLYDGTVRCADCMDASTYADETNEPCLYCGHVPATETDTVSLVKEYGIPFGGFLSAEMAEEYRTYELFDHVTAIYGDHGRTLYRHLRHNCLDALSALITYRDCYDNVTGTLDITRSQHKIDNQV